jgi:hypothetical protein
VKLATPLYLYVGRICFHQHCFGAHLNSRIMYTGCRSNSEESVLPQAMDSSVVWELRESIVWSQFYFAGHSTTWWSAAAGGRRPWTSLKNSGEMLQKTDGSLASPNCPSLLYFIFHWDSYAYTPLPPSHGFRWTKRGRESKACFVEQWNLKLKLDEYKTDTLRKVDMLW